MATPQKLSTLLGLRDRLSNTFDNMLKDMIDKFKNKPGLFMGERKTYSPLDGFADDDSKRKFTNVASTVNEQLDWFFEHSLEHFKLNFSVEKTNASGAVKATLFVDGVDFGEYSSLELLRLKTIIDGNLRQMVAVLPVRDESQIWTPSTDDMYANRDVFQTPRVDGFAKTTLKTSYILTDPHADKNPNRPPMLGEESKQVNIGAYTSQMYSGQLSMRERAEMLVRLDTLYKGVIAALEKANNVEVVQSDLGDKALKFLLKK